MNYIYLFLFQSHEHYRIFSVGCGEPPAFPPSLLIHFSDWQLDIPQYLALIAQAHRSWYNECIFIYFHFRFPRLFCHGVIILDFLTFWKNSIIQPMGGLRKAVILGGELLCPLFCFNLILNTILLTSLVYLCLCSINGIAMNLIIRIAFILFFFFLRIGIS